MANKTFAGISQIVLDYAPRRNYCRLGPSPFCSYTLYRTYDHFFVAICMVALLEMEIFEFDMILSICKCTPVDRGAVSIDQIEKP